MPRHHLAIRNFKPSVIAAAVALFAEKPWALASIEEQETVAQNFADGITTAYGCAPVKVTLDDCDSWQTGYVAADEEYQNQSAEILMDRWSIYTLMTHVRTHVLATGSVEPIGDDPQMDPTKWACSLFYAVKPVMFRARVREGRIASVTARDTYSTDSWVKLEEAGYTLDDRLTGDAAQWSAVLAGQPVPVSDSIPDEDENDVDESSIATPDNPDWANTDGSVNHTAIANEFDDGLDSLTRDQVRALAVQNNIPRGNMNKTQLIAALRFEGVRA